MAVTLELEDTMVALATPVVDTLPQDLDTVVLPVATEELMAVMMPLLLPVTQQVQHQVDMMLDTLLVDSNRSLAATEEAMVAMLMLALVMVDTMLESPEDTTEAMAVDTVAVTEALLAEESV